MGFCWTGPNGSVVRILLPKIVLIFIGYHMAKNLRAKIPSADTLLIRDVNEEAAKRFVAETEEIARNSGANPGEGRVQIAASAREIAEQSVSLMFDRHLDSM